MARSPEGEEAVADVERLMAGATVGVRSVDSWSTWKEAFKLCTRRTYLIKTLRIALFVGTILFAINQLDVFLAGEANAGVWLKVLLTYLVPFCVANWGILAATRRAR
jgi:hypothetical protein